ncbi:DNA polymerase epsilon subunit D [Penicillium ucsense]|uniref:DNA polymerase epsilon subunit D n=1 Tax=Penicillium ucsense TaxID=2839758 RepID=A0A8J8WM57_9EURO|nr:DNA polymerase epsilon subunit D [Penicillium ucsense]KAF7736835.1 DNA polymerase epsilon subunit D [Penicillium ucsense]
MPPRKSTSSVTPADTEEVSQLSPQAQGTADKPITATEQQIKARAEQGVSVEDYLLPRSLTIRLAKSVLPPNTTIQKDAVLAIQKAATVFISYLSSHANDATLKRTVAPADVFDALTELELDAFRPRLEKELEAFTEIKAGKRKAKKADANGGTTAGASSAAARTSGGVAEDEDVEMVDKPAKRVKRSKEQSRAAGQPRGNEETQGEEEENEAEEEKEEEEEEENDEDEEEAEEEAEEEGEDEEDEDDDDDDEHRADEDLDRIEDLDGTSRQMDPDADETDDEGPASQLQGGLDLG